MRDAGSANSTPPPLGVGFPSATTWVALLRSVNVAGRNRIAMAGLRELTAQLGFTQVRTHLQSGNLVFSSPEPAASRVAEALSQAIAASLGLDVKVVVRTGLQLAEVVRRNPLLAAGQPARSLHITFLASPADPVRLEALDRTAGAPDAFQVLGTEVFLTCPGGYGSTLLNNAYFERKLQVSATTRNWATVCQLAHMAGEVP